MNQPPVIELNGAKYRHYAQFLEYDPAAQYYFHPSDCIMIDDVMMLKEDSIQEYFRWLSWDDSIDWTDEEFLDDLNYCEVEDF